MAAKINIVSFHPIQRQTLKFHNQLCRTIYDQNYKETEPKCNKYEQLESQEACLAKNQFYLSTKYYNALLQVCTYDLHNCVKNPETFYQVTKITGTTDVLIIFSLSDQLSKGVTTALEVNYIPYSLSVYLVVPDTETFEHVKMDLNDWADKHSIQFFFPFQLSRNHSKTFHGVSLLENYDTDNIDTLIASLICHPWSSMTKKEFKFPKIRSTTPQPELDFTEKKSSQRVQEKSKEEKDPNKTSSSKPHSNNENDKNKKVDVTKSREGTDDNGCENLLNDVNAMFDLVDKVKSEAKRGNLSNKDRKKKASETALLISNFLQ